jgi:hypothetical protein
MPTKCRSCGAPIEFVRTQAGKLTPVRADSGEPHWIDCPQRRSWRKGGPTGTPPDDVAAASPDPPATDVPAPQPSLFDEPPPAHRPRPYFDV